VRVPAAVPDDPVAMPMSGPVGLLRQVGTRWVERHGEGFVSVESLDYAPVEGPNLRKLRLGFGFWLHEEESTYVDSAICTAAIYVRLPCRLSRTKVTTDEGGVDSMSSERHHTAVLRMMIELGTPVISVSTRISLASAVNS
jgi:hypothetical protein